MGMFQLLPRLNLNVFTPAVNGAIGVAVVEASALKSPAVQPEHLFLGILGSCKGAAVDRLGQPPVQILAKTRELLRSSPHRDDPAESARKPYRTVEKPMSPETKRVLRKAIAKAKSLGHGAVGTEHVMLALLDDQPGKLPNIFQSIGINPQESVRAVERTFG